MVACQPAQWGLACTQIEDCNRLQAIEMHVSAMTHLALGSCPSLEMLMLRAPALTHLDLQCVPYSQPSSFLFCSPCPARYPVVCPSLYILILRAPALTHLDLQCAPLKLLR